MAPKKDKDDKKKTKRGALTERDTNAEVKPPKRSDSTKKRSKKTDENADKVTKTSKKKEKKDKKTKPANGTRRGKENAQESVGLDMGDLSLDSRDTSMGSIRTEDPAVRGTNGDVEVEMEDDVIEMNERGEYMEADPEPRKTWKIDGPPITDPANVPSGWSANEPDLYEFDIEGNIERNIERIKEGILPHFFESRLMHYEKLKRERDSHAIIGGKSDLTYAVRVRIDTLKRIEANLVMHGDSQEQLGNVRGLIEAYSNKTLEWNPPNVTYWYAGKIYKGPEPLDKEKMSGYWKELGRPTSWWVEGWQGPGPTPVNYNVWLRPIKHDAYMHMLNIAVRPTDLPQQATENNVGWLDLECLDDTGSENMMVYESDIAQIESTCGFVFQEMGQALITTATGQADVRAVLAQVCLKNPTDRYSISPKCDIVIFVRRGYTMPGIPRLSGIWVRHMVYSLTIPDNQGRLFLNEEGFPDTRPNGDGGPMPRPIPPPPYRLGPGGPRYMRGGPARGMGDPVRQGGVGHQIGPRLLRGGTIQPQGGIAQPLPPAPPQPQGGQVPPNRPAPLMGGTRRWGEAPTQTWAQIHADTVLATTHARHVREAYEKGVQDGRNQAMGVEDHSRPVGLPRRTGLRPEQDPNRQHGGWLTLGDQLLQEQRGNAGGPTPAMDVATEAVRAEHDPEEIDAYNQGLRDGWNQIVDHYTGGDGGDDNGGGDGGGDGDGGDGNGYDFTPRGLLRRASTYFRRGDQQALPPPDGQGPPPDEQQALPAPPDPAAPRTDLPHAPGSILTAEFEAMGPPLDFTYHPVPERPRPPPQRYVRFRDQRVPIAAVQERIATGWEPDIPLPFRPPGYIPLLNPRTGEINPFWIDEVEQHDGIFGVFYRMTDWVHANMRPGFGG